MIATLLLKVPVSFKCATENEKLMNKLDLPGPISPVKGAGKENKEGKHGLTLLYNWQHLHRKGHVLAYFQRGDIGLYLHTISFTYFQFCIQFFTYKFTHKQEFLLLSPIQTGNPHYHSFKDSLPFDLLDNNFRHSAVSTVLPNEQTILKFGPVLVRIRSQDCIWLVSQRRLQQAGIAEAVGKPINIECHCPAPWC